MAQPTFEVYNKIKLLGEGAFGKAFLADTSLSAKATSSWRLSNRSSFLK